MATVFTTGNLDPNGMTLDDIIRAVEMTWDTEVPAPHGVDPALITEIVSLTAGANRRAGRTMGYGAALAWGITIGVLAERNRLERTSS